MFHIALINPVGFAQPPAAVVGVLEADIIKKTTKTSFEYDTRGLLTRSVSDIQEDRSKSREIQTFENGYLIHDTFEE